MKDHSNIIGKIKKFKFKCFYSKNYFILIHDHKVNYNTNLELSVLQNHDKGTTNTSNQFI